ncbi:hypothetical protein L3Y34_012708 [Caenorhabditis briggsae]|uniref:Uncharacterized protein n=1 Tax=Caenorhabditis briggsae TaxID=6238 RepID=A0AAE9CWY1_CAEBR|nr:hypothetical protein L3Y34_012708 [Caenorhabditis briggsae]
MSSLNKEMNDLSSAMEEVRLSSQPIDMEESSEAVTMEEDSNMSVDEKREQEYKLRVLEALEKGVQHQLKKKKDLGEKSMQKYHWTGGIYYSQQWRPYIEEVESLLTILEKKWSRPGRYSDLSKYVDILSDLGVLGQMKECILDKNKYIDKKLSEKALSDSALSNYSRQNAPVKTITQTRKLTDSELVHMPDMQNERDATDYYEMTPGGCDVHVIRSHITHT